MTFELSILRKYLIPRRGQLSSAFIAFVSLGVISAVVWLVLLFLSVTEGIEKVWLAKLTSLQAPIRVTPTNNYFNCPHHLVDTISHKAGYTVRALSEKIRSPGALLYDPEVDESLPKQWALLDKKDPVPLAWSLIQGMKKKIPDLECAPFEMGGAILKIQLQSQSVLTQASYLSSFPEGISYVQNLLLPGHQLQERGIVVAKGFYETGARIGDTGWIQYQALAAGALQEMRLPIVISGFYDPGVLAVGNKCILASEEIVHLIRAASPVEHFDQTASMGFSLWHRDLKKTKHIAKELEKQLTDAGIGTYWKVTTYHDYEFAKDLMQQFQSDRTLFTFLGLIVLIVACCNIISFLILLVQDKKQEIGILQALGASKKSIACIFGGCGAAIGLVSGLIGITGAFLTLRNLDTMIKFLSFVQGHPAFNAAFYGSSLPSEMSLSALLFVAIVTPLLSLIAGLIPAWKACRLSPSAILRSES